MREFMLRLALLVLLGASALAQDDPKFDRVPLRVTAIQPGGWVGVDRGAEEGLAKGQRVQFTPRSGGVIEGTVESTAARTAVVVLDKPSARLEAGTTGVALVPRVTDATPPEQAVQEEPEFKDDGWTDDLPLLARVGAVQPEDRAPQFYGRTYINFDTTQSDNDRSDTFLRTGVDLVWENPWERGGTMHLDAEFNTRDTSSDYSLDEGTAGVRLDRVSYTVGGTRYQPRGWTAGRMLQSVPELGLLDGVEAFQRLENGDKFGVSMGFQPENDPELHSAEDLQMAAWYRWVADDTERVALTGALQKTWHNGSEDRELVLTKLQILPVDGWSLHVGAWLDLYDSNDVQTDESTELTRAYATTTRSWESGNGMTIGYSRWRFTDLLREEYEQIAPGQVADGGVDRLSWNGWRRVDERKRLLARLSAWTGDDDNGGYGEVGVELNTLWHDQGMGTFTAFTGAGKYEDQQGLRFNYARFLDGGRWDVTYALSNYDVKGFDVTGNELVHHRLRASRSMHDLWGWTFSGYTELHHEDNETAISIGFHMTRGF